MFGPADAPWLPLPVIRLATAGLVWLRWAYNGAASVLPIADQTSLGIRVYHLGDGWACADIWLWQPTRLLAAIHLIPYRELLDAWANFATSVRAFLADEHPALVATFDRQHPDTDAPRSATVPTMISCE